MTTGGAFGWGVESAHDLDMCMCMSALWPSHAYNFKAIVADKAGITVLPGLSSSIDSKSPWKKIRKYKSTEKLVSGGDGGLGAHDSFSPSRL